MNTWKIDIDRQINILVGQELGKTTFLRNLYFNSLPKDCNRNMIHQKGMEGLGFIPSCTPDHILGEGEGKERLKYIFQLTESLAKWEGRQLLIIDNPERGLHVDYQRSLINNILERAPNLKLVMATHSPLILNGWIDCAVRANT